MVLFLIDKDLLLFREFIIVLIELFDFKKVMCVFVVLVKWLFLIRLDKSFCSVRLFMVMLLFMEKLLWLLVMN